MVGVALNANRELEAALRKTCRARCISIVLYRERGEGAPRSSLFDVCGNGTASRKETQQRRSIDCLGQGNETSQQGLSTKETI